MVAKKAKKAKKARGAKANRQIKDTMFCKLFGEAKNAIELVNALLGTKYGADAKAEITTLKSNVFAHGVVNDLSILLDNILLVLIEHQSTVCGNMPLRLLEYVTETYKGFMTDKDVYSVHQIRLPRPVFIVLYNGTAKMGAKELHRLSDSYTKALPAFTGMGGLELEVTVINVNDPRNKKLVKTCKLLDGYRIFNKALDRNKKAMDLLSAIKKTIDDCIARGVLTDFLEKHRKELTTMLFENSDVNKAMKYHGEERFEEGREEGRKEGLAEGIGIGEKKSVMKTALAMKKRGMTIKNISQYMGLSVSTVRRLLTPRS